jgi:hypothetical protein
MWVQWLATFHIVCLAWVFFRADSLTNAGQMLWRFATAWGPAPLVTPLLVFVIAVSIASQFVPEDAVERVQVAFGRLAPAWQGVALAAGFVLIGALGPQGVAPFIYFQF